MVRRSVTGSNLALSLLDVLAGGIGAVILLFLCFAALQRQALTGRTESGSYARLEWRIVRDSEALMRLRVRPPESARDPYLKVCPNRPLSFLVRLDELVNKHDSKHCRLPCTNDSYTIGFEKAGDASVGLKRSEDAWKTNINVDRVFVVRVLDPMPGDWKFDLIYFDRSDTLRGIPDEIMVEGPRVDLGATAERLVSSKPNGPMVKFGDLSPDAEIRIIGGPPSLKDVPVCDVDWLPNNSDQ